MTFVYTLVDPEKLEEVRYVGITGNPTRRWGDHCIYGPRYLQYDSHCLRWTRQLIALGRIPIMVVLEETNTRREASDREKHFIKFYGDNGHPLTNETLGGENSWQLTPEVRSRLREIIRLKWQDPSYRASVLSEENVASLREGARRHWRDPVARAKHIEKLCNANSGVKVSAALLKHYQEHPETRVRLSSSRKRFYAQNPVAFTAAVAQMHTVKARKTKRESCQTPEFRKGASDRMKKRLADPEECDKRRRQLKNVVLKRRLKAIEAARAELVAAEKELADILAEEVLKSGS